MVATQISSGTVSEKGHGTEHELKCNILKAAEGGQNLPGVEGVQSL